ncbi:hypothetical protein BLA29_006311 [Euroglyphus maynei]|uniref:Gustatory receptor n=1 Tax=Euroglyphus maynei TaxID=6958 RepID=A0A1Y3AZK9_EURMA|nr:hypothetical protein BLA29_006311 [Euroglyphus maynei]
MNIVIVERFDQAINIWLMTFFAMIIYFVWILYFGNNTKATELIRSILVDRDSKFFDSDCGDNFQSRIHVHRIHLYLAIYEMKSLYLLYQYGYFDSINGAISIIFHCFLYVFMVIITRKNIQICELIGIFQIVITMALFTRLKQIKLMVMRRENFFKSQKLFTIRHMNNDVLQMTTITDHTYGMMMFLFFLVNYPTNAYMIMIFIIKRMTMLNNIIFIMIIAYQLSFILMFHLIATQYARQIHHPVKFVINQVVELSSLSLSLLISRNSRLKLLFWIENFHTKNLYGITYGRIEVITLKTFCKVIF